nr:hypothetical protein [Rhodothermaceae bacterium]
MINRCLYILALLQLAVVPLLKAQTVIEHEGVRYKVTSLTMDDGLPSNYAYSVVDDPMGWVWIGTANGLVRYDGITFRTYNPIVGDTTSISTPDIGNVYVNPSGELFAFSWARIPGGINQFDSQTETFRRFNTQSSSLPADGITAIYPSRSQPNTLLLGLMDADGIPHLCRFDLNTYEVTLLGEGLSEFLDGSDWIDGLYEDVDGTIWVVKDDGLYKVASEGVSAVPQFLNTRVFSIYEDSDGQLWVGAVGGLYQLDRISGEVVKYTPDNGDNVISIHEDSKGTLWVLYQLEGVATFDRDEHRFISFPYPIKVDFTNDAVSEDRFGMLWINGRDQLIRIQSLDNAYTKYDGESTETYSRAAIKDEKNYVWLAYPGAIHRVNKKTGNVSVIGEFGVSSITQDHRGDIWLSTACNREELVRYIDGDPQERRVYKHNRANDESLGPGCVNPVYEDINGNVWVSLWGNGLDLFNPEDETFRHFAFSRLGIENEGVLYINEVASEPDILWISTERGPVRFDVKKEEFTSFFLTSLERTMMVLEDRKERLWVATASNGLHLLDRENGMIEQSYSVEDGLSHNFVYSIYEDKDGYLWMSTNYGLSQFDPEQEIFRNYYTSNGLPTQYFGEFGKFQSEDGELFFAGKDGVFSFYPEDITLTSRESDMYLTNLQINGEHQKPSSSGPLKQSIRLAESITLSAKQNDVTIDYVGVQPNSPELQQYRYKLEGFDEEWIDAGQQRSARYSLIPAGDYTFRVAAANADGVWSTKEAQLAITVLPPWWRSVYAFVVYGLLLVVGVVGVDRFQRNRVIRKERERARERELAQAREIEQAYTQLKTTQQQLVQQEKMASLGQLTSGIAHEIKNPLNFVNNFAQINEKLVDEILQVKENDPEEFEELLSDLKGNTRQIKKHGARADRIVRNMMEHAASSEGN